ncbi:MAG: recombinase family protein [Methylococcales bacterium]|nr:recombinase family protein [Methylococcales bacterium]
MVVSELSRMTRSLMDLLTTAKLLEQRQINLVSLRENIDTTTATGRCFLSMMGAIHQMERELRAERAAAGRSSAKARGKTGGRPKTAPKNWKMPESYMKTLIKQPPKFVKLLE